jgi:hypothetical protein
MLKLLFYTFFLTILFTDCTAQTNDNFQDNINEMKQYKLLLADDEDLEKREKRLVFDISEGIKNIKVNDNTVDSLGFTQLIVEFLSTNKNKESVLIAGSYDHAKMDNIVVITRIFNQCKSLFDPNNKSKIAFKSFKNFEVFRRGMRSRDGGSD